MRATTTLLLLFILLFTAFSCKQPKQLTISDIKLPDPEGELAKHLGITAIEEVGICSYYPNSTFDEAIVTYYNEHGQELLVYYAYPNSFSLGYYMCRYDEDGCLSAYLGRPADAWCGLVGEEYYSFTYETEIEEGIAYQKLNRLWAFFKRTDTLVHTYNKDLNVVMSKLKASTTLYEYGNGRLLSIVEKKEFARGGFFHKDHVNETDRFGFRTRITRYYYRNETGPLLDSIVSVLTDADDEVRWDSYTKYFDEKGYPTKKVFVDGRVHQLNVVDLDVNKGEFYRDRWEYYEYVQERAKNY